MSEMDLHGDPEPGTPTSPAPPDGTVPSATTAEIDELADPEVPEADAVEQTVPVTEVEPDPEIVPVDEDEYR